MVGVEHLRLRHSLEVSPVPHVLHGRLRSFVCYTDVMTQHASGDAVAWLMHRATVLLRVAVVLHRCVHD
jgi:hypothetical protein